MIIKYTYFKVHPFPIQVLNLQLDCDMFSSAKDST